jgi:DNA-binding NarL/FixJ family response regulator
LSREEDAEVAEARRQSGVASVTSPQGPTLRELEVIDLVGPGKRNSDTARALVATAQTVGCRLTSVFAKLGVRNCTEAAALAIRKRQVAGAAPSFCRPRPR